LNPNYREAIEKPYRWSDWAAEEERGLTGNDLINFVNNDLFPYLRGLVGVNEKDQRTVIAEVFQEIYNSMRSGYLLRDIINLVNRVDFTSSDDIHTMAHLYENMLKEMRDAAGSNGEFYTPRPVIRFIVNQIKPQIGERVLDPFLGGGTTVIESWVLGRRSIGVDVSPHSISLSKKRIAEMAEKAPRGKMNPVLKPEIYEADARNLSFLKDRSVDLVCSQPPYWNAVRYTEYNPNDLSHIKDEKEFCEEFRKVAQEMFRVLKERKICAVQIGDTRKDGKFIPLGFMILKELESTGLKIKDIVIKLQYADRSTAFYKNLKELQIAHEYLFIMKRP